MRQRWPRWSEGGTRPLSASARPQLLGPRLGCPWCLGARRGVRPRGGRWFRRGACSTGPARELLIAARGASPTERKPARCGGSAGCSGRQDWRPRPEVPRQRPCNQAEPSLRERRKQGGASSSRRLSVSIHRWLPHRRPARLVGDATRMSRMVGSAAFLVVLGCAPGHVVKRDDFCRVTTAFANADGARARCTTHRDVPLEQQDAPEASWTAAARRDGVSSCFSIISSESAVQSAVLSGLGMHSAICARCGSTGVLDHAKEVGRLRGHGGAPFGGLVALAPTQQTLTCRR
jgi:hypothetical protein